MLTPPPPTYSRNDVSYPDSYADAFFSFASRLEAAIPTRRSLDNTFLHTRLIANFPQKCNLHLLSRLDLARLYPLSGGASDLQLLFLDQYRPDFISVDLVDMLDFQNCLHLAG